MAKAPPGYTKPTPPIGHAKPPVNMNWLIDSPTVNEELVGLVGGAEGTVLEEQKKAEQEARFKETYKKRLRGKEMAGGAGAVGPGLQAIQIPQGDLDETTSPFPGETPGPEAGFEGSGVGTWSSADLPVDPRYGQSMEELRNIIAGGGYEDLLRQGQYEALTQVGPGEGIAGAVGQTGSRAGGQIAQQRQMSDIQMVQALSGAKVAAQQAKQQAVIAATGEMRNIMQQQLDAYISTQKLGLEAQEAVQNRFTSAFNMINAYVEAAIGTNIIDSEQDFDQLGFNISQWWKKFKNASPEEQMEMASSWPDWFTEEEAEEMGVENEFDTWKK